MFGFYIFLIVLLIVLFLLIIFLSVYRNFFNKSLKIRKTSISLTITLENKFSDIKNIFFDFKKKKIIIKLKKSSLQNDDVLVLLNNELEINKTFKEFKDWNKLIF